MIRWNLSVASVAGVLVCAACGGDAREWTGTVRDSAGVAIVENTTTGIWSGEEAPTVTRELDIGTADGPAETQFGTITGIAVDAEGRIHVLDSQSRTVRVFDAEGAFVREIGGPGTGPGELSQGAAGILMSAGDTLVVPDLLQQRVNRYAPDGTPAGSFPMPLVGGMAIRWDATPDHRLVHQARRFPAPPGGATAGAEEQAPSGDPILVRGLDGTVLDTLIVLPAGEGMQITGGEMRVKVFGSEPVWDLASDGRLFAGANSDFRISVHTPDGKLERIITRPFEERPVTEADKEAIRQALRDFMTRQGLPQQGMDVFFRSMQFADRYPAFATLLAGPGGQLWVQRVRSAESFASSERAFDANDIGSPEWDVFDRDGRYLGVVTLPDRFQPLSAEEDLLYGVWRDDLDVQHVLRLRVGT